MADVQPIAPKKGYPIDQQVLVYSNAGYPCPKRSVSFQGPLKRIAVLTGDGGEAGVDRRLTA